LRPSRSRHRRCAVAANHDGETEELLLASNVLNRLAFQAAGDQCLKAGGRFGLQRLFGVGEKKGAAAAGGVHQQQFGVGASALRVGARAQALFGGS
jgi:hypothetical protein